MLQRAGETAILTRAINNAAPFENRPAGTTIRADHALRTARMILTKPSGSTSPNAHHHIANRFPPSHYRFNARETDRLDLPPVSGETAPDASAGSVLRVLQIR
ncbi:hypothetical protein [Mesorhizobium sp. M0146]|uniref:hypothetical protein n=1 Tax=unclassified Mesorhizobium TaxID=325217 RepID=UPI00333BAE74